VKGSGAGREIPISHGDTIAVTGGQEMAEEIDTRRHPIRSLVKMAGLVGIIYAIGRFLIRKKEEYSDLTETQARQKLLDKLGPRLGEETAVEIADQVIPKLRERGFIRPDLVDMTVEDMENEETVEGT
jgi:hypothetical protein